MYATTAELEHRIRSNIRGFDRIAAAAPRRAAVGVVLAPVDGVAHYAFTQRALHLRRGAGQYALPGGGAEDGEDAVAAVVREVREELGIVLAESCVLGLLDDIVTRTGHVVTPVVLWSDTPLLLRPDPQEVHDAWWVPVAELDSGDAPRRIAHPDGGNDIVQMPVRGEWVNAPTAAILYQFRDVALHARPTRVHDVGQPSWTAK